MSQYIPYRKKNYVDGLVIVLLIGIILFGCLNIYSVTRAQFLFNPSNIMSNNAFKQFLWIGISIPLYIIIFSFKSPFYIVYSRLLYILSIGLLFLASIYSHPISGHNSWLHLGSLRFQPSEFSKLGTLLMVSNIFGDNVVGEAKVSKRIYLLITIFLPMFLVILQGDLGSSIVFFSFLIPLFRENCFVIPILTLVYISILSFCTLFFPSFYLSVLIICLYMVITYIYGVEYHKVFTLICLCIFSLIVINLTNFSVNRLLKAHQRARIYAWIHPDKDPRGIGWNVRQSKVAIGSGGVFGKGIFEGSQTKYGFVPRQHTDFIFCTVGEEYGWIGTSLLICAYVCLILRILFLSEKQKFVFPRVYGYGCAGILFFHVFVNIGMTMGLIPVIGIPLPFFSYGGSSFVTFCTMVFIFLRFDYDRKQQFANI